MSQPETAAATGFGPAALTGLHRASRPDVSEPAFERDFLARLTHLVHGSGIAVWFDPGGETLYLRYKQHLPVEDLQRDAESWKQHGRMLKQCSGRDEPVILPPGWSEGEAGNPTSREVLVASAGVHHGQWVLLEVFREPGAGLTSSGEADLAILRTAAEFAADRIRAQQMLQMSKTQADWKKLDRFAQRVHLSLDLEKSAYLIANEAAALLGVDRVTVAVRQRNKVKVVAVSGQTVVHGRANLVRLQERLAKGLLNQPTALIVGPRVRQVEAPLAESVDGYLAESAAKTLFGIPLRMKSGDKAEGVLFIEQFDERITAETIADRVPHVAAHAVAALQNARAHSHVFLASTRTKIGRTLAESVKFRRLVLFAILASIGAALYLVPTELRMEGKGALRAEVRRGVFAPEGGTVRQVSVEHGSPVKAGNPLAVIENTELNVQLQQAREEFVSNNEMLRLKEAEMQDRTLPKQRQIQIDGEIAEITEKLAYLNARIELLTARIAAMKLTAPIDGVVASWDPQKQLRDRPVQAGSLLLHVISEEGPWRLEIKLPEVDAGPVLHAWRNRPEGEGVPVEYLLATYPDRRYQGSLVDIALTTEVIDNEPIIKLIVEPDPNDPPPLRDGAEVRAKISCGRRSLGYVIFRELIEFVHSRVLFLF